MKRPVVALCIQPYKNGLCTRPELKKGIDRFARFLLSLVGSYPSVRFNLILPGYLLEVVDPIVLNDLREAHKRGVVEWATPGYTEPFLSFSPRWLTRENIRRGREVFGELLDAQPSVYVPPFSNWEPSLIDLLTDLGLSAVAISDRLIRSPYRSRRRVWATEHAGHTTTLIPLSPLHSYNAPAIVSDWISRQFQDENDDEVHTPVLGIRYLLPLLGEGKEESTSWLKTAARLFEKKVLELQTMRLSDYLADQPPAGLQYLQPGIDIHLDRSTDPPRGWNWLFTYDQVGILLRRMLESAESFSTRELHRQNEPLLNDLFFAQDINRFLPLRSAGFTCLEDRESCYRRVIRVDRELHDRDQVKGGQIRIADFFRNGTKSIIMSNNTLKVYLDHQNGGSIFECDYRPAGVNLAAAYRPRRHPIPQAIAPGWSPALFTDRILAPDTGITAFSGGAASELGDFVGGRYDYSIKKTGAGAKVVLHRQGAILQEKKSCPLSIEKVFGLEGDKGVLSFVYKVINGSLAPYAFRYAVELNLAFPGGGRGEVKLTVDGKTCEGIAGGRTEEPGARNIVFTDTQEGMKITLALTKPADCWVFPVEPVGPYQGTVVVLSLPLTLKGNDAATLMGRILCDRIRRRGKTDDAF